VNVLKVKNVNNEVQVCVNNVVNKLLPGVNVSYTTTKYDIDHDGDKIIRVTIVYRRGRIYDDPPPGSISKILFTLNNEFETLFQEPPIPVLRLIEESDYLYLRSHT
jgi:hypothetical protein